MALTSPVVSAHSCFPSHMLTPGTQNKFMPGTERCRMVPFAYSKGQLHLENPPPATTTLAPPLGNLPGNRQAYKTQLTSSLKFSTTEMTGELGR